MSEVREPRGTGFEIGYGGPTRKTSSQPFQKSKACG